MIEVQELTKRYGIRTAIDSISFAIQKGEIMGFLGPNGAGKTTTMRILAGVMGATHGTAAIAGFDIHDDPQAAKRRTGYLPEVPPVYPDMSVTAYLDFAAQLHGSPSKKRKAQVDLALEKMGLQEVQKRLIGHLSKGFQQRVGIAQALVHDPEVLILDEPTVGLDPSQIREIRQLIRDLAGQHTIILSTHILPEVEMTCEKVVLINKGSIRYDGTIEDLLREKSGKQVIDLQIARPSEQTMGQLATISGISDVASISEREHIYRLDVDTEADPREAVAKLVVENNWGLLGLKQIAASLEDIFVQLTTEEAS